MLAARAVDTLVHTLQRWVMMGRAFLTLLALPLLVTGCDLFDSGSGNRRSFDIVFENQATESIHVDFANKTHGPSNLLEPMQVRVQSASATIGEFLRFEAGRNQVTLATAECQLVTADPTAARVIWDGTDLSCSGFDGSSSTSSGGGSGGSSGSGSGSGGTGGSGSGTGGSGSGTATTATTGY